MWPSLERSQAEDRFGKWHGKWHAKSVQLSVREVANAQGQGESDNRHQHGGSSNVTTLLPSICWTWLLNLMIRQEVMLSKLPTMKLIEVDIVVSLSLLSAHDRSSEGHVVANNLPINLTSQTQSRISCH